MGPLNSRPVVFFSATRKMMLKLRIVDASSSSFTLKSRAVFRESKAESFPLQRCAFSCQMSSLCSLGPALQWRPKSMRFLFFFDSKRRTSAFVPRVTSSSSIDDDTVSGPKAKQVQYLIPLLFLFFENCCCILFNWVGLCNCNGSWVTILPRTFSGSRPIKSQGV